jgi:hypothetical protein
MAQRWKQPNIHQQRLLTNKTQFIHGVGFGHKRSKTWMNLEHVLRPHMAWFYLYNIYRIEKCRDRKQVGGCQGLG